MSKHRHHHSTQSPARDTVSLVFSFFLSIVLLAMTFLTVLRVGIFTEGGILSVFDNQYYEYVQSYIKEQAEYYTLPTGIDPEVLDKVFVVSEIKENIDGYVVSLFGGYGFEPDVTAARDRLEANVRNAFASDGVSISKDEEAEQVASAYADEVISFYASVLKPTGLDVVVEVRNQYCKFYPYVMIGLGALAVLLVVFIKRLHHFLHRSLRYVAYAVGGATLMEFVVPAVLFAMGTYKGLSLAPQYFYYLGVTLIERVLKLCMMGSAVLAVVMAVLVFVVSRMRSTALDNGRLRRGKRAHSNEEQG